MKYWSGCTYVKLFTIAVLQFFFFYIFFKHYIYLIKSNSKTLSFLIEICFKLYSRIQLSITDYLNKCMLLVLLFILIKNIFFLKICIYILIILNKSSTNHMCRHWVRKYFWELYLYFFSVIIIIHLRFIFLKFDYWTKNVFNYNCFN